MAEPATSPTPPARPSPDEAAVAVRRIAKAWELDSHDAAAMLGAPGDELGSLTWTDERLLRMAYLIELEAALIRLNPKGGIAHWIIATNPGPFFSGNAPLQMLTGSTREIVELLRQVQRWGGSRG